MGVACRHEELLISRPIIITHCWKPTITDIGNNFMLYASQEAARNSLPFFNSFKKVRKEVRGLSLGLKKKSEFGKLIHFEPPFLLPCFPIKHKSW
jgi:hypothetical protein